MSGLRCYLSSFQLFQPKRWSRGRFNCICTVACKGPVCVQVLTTFCGSFFVEVGHFNQLKVPPLGPPFFLFFYSASLPEVNQFTGNCFRMVRIVLKITFLTLRCPKSVTRRLPLCPIMALSHTYSQQLLNELALDVRW